MRCYFILITFIMLGAAHGAKAQSLVEEDYVHAEPLATDPWYEYYGEENRAADMRFIVGMRPHHAGALSMVDEYFANGDGTSGRLAALARGIYHNQTFEISMLTSVEELITPIEFHGGKKLHQVAEKGLAQNTYFVRLPMPAIQPAFAPHDQVSEEDVRFAKAMIVHHEGALMMAWEYLNDPHSTNGYLERMCLDILRDQAQEIALMHNVIAHYPGDADAIKIEPSMVHGMDDMMHHMDLSSVNGEEAAHQGHHGHD